MEKESEEGHEIRALMNLYCAYDEDTTDTSDEDEGNDNDNDDEHGDDKVDDDKDDIIRIFRSEEYLNKAYRDYKFVEEVSSLVEIPKNMDKSKVLMMLKPPEYESYSNLGAMMVNCVPNGDVKILIIEEGEGPLVPVDAEVMIHYACYEENKDTPFISTLDNNSTGAPKRFRLGSTKTFPGIELGLTRVRGPKAQFYLMLQPTVPWSTRTRNPALIPATTLAVISVEVVIDLQAPIRYQHLPLTEKVKYKTTTPAVDALFYRAEKQFKQKKYEQAIQNYLQSRNILQSAQPEDKKEEDTIKIYMGNAFINLAVCFYILDQPENMLNTLRSLFWILWDLVPPQFNKHSKALFYYGRAYAMLGNPDDAIKIFQLGLQLDPGNIYINQALIDLKTLMAERKTKFGEEVSESCRTSTRLLIRDLASTNFDEITLSPTTPDINVEYLKEYVKNFTGFNVTVTGSGNEKIISVIRV